MKVKFKKVNVIMLPMSTMLVRLGVNPTGAVQLYATEMVNHRITRYMPFRTGAIATKTKFFGGAPHLPGQKNQNTHLVDEKKITSPTEITVIAPYAHYQYAGKVWVDPKINAAGFLTANGWRSRKGAVKEETDRALTYDRGKNEEAGPLWDRRLMMAEGAQMAEDLQEYVNKRMKKR